VLNKAKSSFKTKMHVVRKSILVASATVGVSSSHCPVCPLQPPCLKWVRDVQKVLQVAQEKTKGAKAKIQNIKDAEKLLAIQNSEKTGHLKRRLLLLKTRTLKKCKSLDDCTAIKNANQERAKKACEKFKESERAIQDLKESFYNKTIERLDKENAETKNNFQDWYEAQNNLNSQRSEFEALAKNGKDTAKNERRKQEDLKNAGDRFSGKNLLLSGTYLIKNIFGDLVYQRNKPSEGFQVGDEVTLCLIPVPHIVLF
jgi:adenine-specific DNA glycosylase